MENIGLRGGSRATLGSIPVCENKVDQVAMLVVRLSDANRPHSDEGSWV